MKTFASDNFSSVCTEVFEYLIDINNSGHAVSYDGDDVTQQAVELLTEAFGTAHGILFVPSGTGANILALKLLLERSYDAVVTSSVAHVYEEESGSSGHHSRGNGGSSIYGELIVWQGAGSRTKIEAALGAGCQNIVDDVVRA